jgi:hypothetical protein
MVMGRPQAPNPILNPANDVTAIARQVDFGYRARV